jgi:hypothetical protein
LNGSDQAVSNRLHRSGRRTSGDRLFSGQQLGDCQFSEEFLAGRRQAGRHDCRGQPRQQQPPAEEKPDDYEATNGQGHPAAAGMPLVMIGKAGQQFTGGATATGGKSSDGIEFADRHLGDGRCRCRAANHQPVVILSTDFTVQVWIGPADGRSGSGLDQKSASIKG